jgi:hypothetical protein
MIRLYELGQASDFMDRVLDKVFAQEAVDTRNAIARLESDIANYETLYSLSSETFFRQFKAGELGDKMDFIEWSSLVMMRDDLYNRLQALTGEE